MTRAAWARPLAVALAPLLVVVPAPRAGGQEPACAVASRQPDAAACYGHALIASLAAAHHEMVAADTAGATTLLEPLTAALYQNRRQWEGVAGAAAILRPYAAARDRAVRALAQTQLTLYTSMRRGPR